MLKNPGNDASVPERYWSVLQVCLDREILREATPIKSWQAALHQREYSTLVLLEQYRADEQAFPRNAIFI